MSRKGRPQPQSHPALRELEHAVLRHLTAGGSRYDLVVRVSAEGRQWVEGVAYRTPHGDLVLAGLPVEVDAEQAERMRVVDGTKRE